MVSIWFTVFAWVFSTWLLIGCIGLLRNAHEMYTDMGLITGFALAFYGLALSHRRVIVAGILLGTGVGVGFMSKGLMVPGVIGVIQPRVVLSQPGAPSRPSLRQ